MGQLKNFAYHLTIGLVLVMLAPVFYVIILFDSQRLQATALTLEPVIDPTDAYPECQRGVLNWTLRYAVRPVLIATVLPVIVLVGGVMTLFSGNWDDDELIH